MSKQKINDFNELLKDIDSIFNIIDDQDSQKKTLTMEHLFSLVEELLLE